MQGVPATQKTTADLAASLSHLSVSSIAIHHDHHTSELVHAADY